VLDTPPPGAGNNTRTWLPHFRRVRSPPAIMRHDPDRAANPGAPYIESGKEQVLLCHYRPLRTGSLPPKRPRALRTPVPPLAPDCGCLYPGCQPAREGDSTPALHLRRGTPAVNAAIAPDIARQDLAMSVYGPTRSRRSCRCECGLKRCCNEFPTGFGVHLPELRLRETPCIAESGI